MTVEGDMLNGTEIWSWQGSGSGNSCPKWSERRHRRKIRGRIAPRAFVDQSSLSSVRSAAPYRWCHGFSATLEPPPGIGAHQKPLCPCSVSVGQHPRLPGRSRSLWSRVDDVAGYGRSGHFRRWDTRPPHPNRCIQRWLPAYQITPDTRPTLWGAYRVPAHTSPPRRTGQCRRSRQQSP